MKKYTPLLSLAAILLLVGAGCTTQQPTTPPADTMMDGNHNDTMMEGETMLKDDADVMMKDDTMIEGDPEAMLKDDAMMKDDSMMEEDGAMMEEDTKPISFSGTVLAGSTSPLLDFNAEDYEKAKNSDKLIVIYFYANWCPICKKEVTSGLYPAFNELKEDNVVGFRVNYKDSDTNKNEENLAREFGVAYQHTKVFLKNGERVLKAPNSWDKSDYLKNITALTN